MIIMNTIFISGALFKQGLSAHHVILRTSPLPVLMAGWWFFTFLLTSIYTTELYVNLLTGHKPYTIDTLDQLLSQPGAKIYMLRVSC